MNIASVFAYALILPLAGMMLRADTKSPAPVTIAIIAGPGSHRPGAHEVTAGARLIQHCLQHAENLPPIDVNVYYGWPDDIHAFDGVKTVVFTGDTFPAARARDPQVAMAHMAELAKRGCGMVAVHYALGLKGTDVAPDGDHPLLNWLGGYFATEPEARRSVARVLTAQITPTGTGHPVLNGVSAFEVNDEPYYNMYFGPNGISAGVTPLVTALLPPEGPKTEVIAWAKQRTDGGRGVGVGMPHFFRNWEKESLRRLILNSIVWSAGMAVPAEGVQTTLPDIARFKPQATDVDIPEYKVIPAAKPEDLTAAADDGSANRFTTWSTSHGDAGSRRYSSLTQINRTNVHQLKPAWTYHSKDGARNIQSNPIIVNGVMFAPTAGRAIVAIDGASGVERWRHQLPAVKPGLDDAPARRGLVYWPGDSKSSARIIFTYEKWVYALDPQSGNPIEEFGNQGRVALPTGGTAAGVIAKDILVVPGLYGDIYGYNIRTGQQVWRFHTVPREGEFGADTWIGTARGRANCWGGLALDESRGIVYAAIGAAQVNFVGVGREGDNLFGNCVVALEAETGRRLWHFQNVRHDIWDMDNPAPPNLVTITREGRKVDAVACVTKLGTTLLLDRVTGEPIFPFRLRRAPRSKFPGEVTATYQPDPELPEHFSEMEFHPDNITDISPEARTYVQNAVKDGVYGWFKPLEEGRLNLWQSTHGGAEWTGACIDVPTGRLYVSANHVLSAATLAHSDEGPRDPNFQSSAGEDIYMSTCAGCHGADRQGMGMVPQLIGVRHRMTENEILGIIKHGRNAMPPLAAALADNQYRDLMDFVMRRNQPPPARGGPKSYFRAGKFITDAEGYPGIKPPWGTLNCIDLNTGKLLWKVPLGEYAELTARGLPKTGTENFGGPTVTAGGLVFCAGTRDSKFRAFDADTGEELWSATLPWVGSAPPAVYEIQGRQYVVVAATGGGKLGTPEGDAYVAFALPSPS